MNSKTKLSFSLALGAMVFLTTPAFAETAITNSKKEVEEVEEVQEQSLTSIIEKSEKLIAEFGDPNKGFSAQARTEGLRLRTELNARCTIKFAAQEAIDKSVKERCSEVRQELDDLLTQSFLR